MAEHKFGNVPGVAEGDTFLNRAEVRKAGIHFKHSSWH